MRRLLLIPLLTLAACAGEPDAPATDPTTMSEADAASVAIGDAVPAGDALTPDELIARADELDGKTVTVEGTVREVCQQAGCWLSLANAEGQTFRVNVPRDESESYVSRSRRTSRGATVRLAGTLDVEMESVDDLRHSPRTEGQSQAEVEAITEPKRTLVLTAIGAEVLARPAPDATAAPSAPLPVPIRIRSVPHAAGHDRRADPRVRARGRSCSSSASTRASRCRTSATTPR